MDEIQRESIVKQVIDYYNKIMYLYIKANSRSKERRLLPAVGSLFWLSDKSCLDIDTIDAKGLYRHIYTEDCYWDFICNVMYYFDLLSELSKKTIDVYRECDFPFYDWYKEARYVPFEDMARLVEEFLHSFDDEFVSIFLKRDEKNDYYFFESDDDYEGIVFPFPQFEKSIIHLNMSNEQDLYFVCSLAHEMGHVYEKELFYGNGDVYLVDNHTRTIFCEVVSLFFEYAFINYLRECGYYRKEIKNEFDTYYRKLFKNAFDMYAICENGSSSVIDEDYNVKLDNKDKMDKIELLKGKLNFFEDLPEYGDTISLRDSPIYFIGQLFAMSLYDNYKKNPKEFMKALRTALVNYPRTRNLDTFEMVGINKEELLSGKVLKRKIEEFKHIK